MNMRKAASLGGYLFALSPAGHRQAGLFSNHYGYAFYVGCVVYKYSIYAPVIAEAIAEILIFSILLIAEFVHLRPISNRNFALKIIDMDSI
jgi:hypothetical protein